MKHSANKGPGDLYSQMQSFIDKSTVKVENYTCVEQTSKDTCLHCGLEESCNFNQLPSLCLISDVQSNSVARFGKVKN